MIRKATIASQLVIAAGSLPTSNCDCTARHASARPERPMTEANRLTGRRSRDLPVGRLRTGMVTVCDMTGSLAGFFISGIFSQNKVGFNYVDQTFSANLQWDSAMLVALLASPCVQLLDVTGPTDVFAEASRQLGDPQAYKLRVISTGPQVISSSSGLRLVADATVVSHRGAIDTLLVAGSPDVGAIVGDERTEGWLRKQASRVRRIGSVCSGAFMLASAGLLDGKRVTTHWNFAAR